MGTGRAKRTGAGATRGKFRAARGRTRTRLFGSLLSADNGLQLAHNRPNCLAHQSRAQLKCVLGHQWWHAEPGGCCSFCSKKIRGGAANTQRLLPQSPTRATPTGIARWVWWERPQSSIERRPEHVSVCPDRPDG